MKNMKLPQINESFLKKEPFVMKNLLRSIILTLSCFLIGFGFTQSYEVILEAESIVLSPRTIIYNPAAAFSVDVSLDKDPSNTTTPSYYNGDELKISVNVSEDAYVYLFEVQGNGNIVQLLPNRLDGGEDNYVIAGNTRYFPSAKSKYTFTISGPNGLEKILALASTRPLDFNALTRFSENARFALIYQSESAFAQRLSIIVNNLAQDEWVTDTALFYVGDAPKVPSYGNLVIDSYPNNALVYVDGQYVGQSPITFGTFPGLHKIAIGKTGFNTVQATVDLVGGQRLSYSPILEPAVVNNIGTVDFISSKEGVYVYVADNYLGKTPLYGITFFPGSYQARFVRPGYSEQTLAFDVVAQQDTVVTIELSSNPNIISGRLGLKNYPNATVKKLIENGSSLDATIISEALLNDVYSNFHNQIIAAGWARDSASVYQDNTTGIILATYHRGSSLVDMVLQEKGEDLFQLRLNFIP